MEVFFKKTFIFPAIKPHSFSCGDKWQPVAERRGIYKSPWENFGVLLPGISIKDFQNLPKDIQEKVREICLFVFPEALNFRGLKNIKKRIMR